MFFFLWAFGISGSDLEIMGKTVTMVLRNEQSRHSSGKTEGNIGKLVRIVDRGVRTSVPTHCRSEIHDVTALATETECNYGILYNQTIFSLEGHRPL